MLHAPLRLPGANERRRNGFSRLSHPVGLHQKQLALSEFEEGFATLRIGTSTEHIGHCFLLKPKSNSAGKI
jgi:hypothetical protein